MPMRVTRSGSCSRCQYTQHMTSTTNTLKALLTSTGRPDTSTVTATAHATHKHIHPRCVNDSVTILTIVCVLCVCVCVCAYVCAAYELAAHTAAVAEDQRLHRVVDGEEDAEED